MTQPVSTTRQREADVIALLEEAGGKLAAEDDIQIGPGKQFRLPEGTSYQDGIRILHKKVEEDENTMAFKRQFPFRPYDGALATMRMFRRVFGLVVHSSHGWSLPQLIDVPVDVGKTEQVPWGDLEIPVIPGVTFVLGGYRDEEYGTLFEINAIGPRKERFKVNGVFDLIDKELREQSLYRGKAFDGREKPEFIDTSVVDRSKVVYSDETIRQIEANVWALLRYTDNFRKEGLPLKRAVLFEGPYGTGKTLASTITAQEAIANGWTFIYCRPNKDNIDECLATARLYQPSVVFVEDVDIIAEGESESKSSIARMLDLFDGISAKNTEILMVLTTNHVEQIHKGMIRPGRLDAIIHIGELDAGGIERMAYAVLPALQIDPTTDWELVASAMSGFLPAFVKEAIDRARYYALVRGAGKIGVLTTQDLVDAGLELRDHLELMEGAKEGRVPDALGQAIKRSVSEAVAEVLELTSFHRANDHQVNDERYLAAKVKEDA
jgi:transitional endoplasmic reticulum ATPase